MCTIIDSTCYLLGPICFRAQSARAQDGVVYSRENQTTIIRSPPTIRLPTHTSHGQYKFKRKAIPSFSCWISTSATIPNSTFEWWSALSSGEAAMLGDDTSKRKCEINHIFKNFSVRLWWRRLGRWGDVPCTPLRSLAHPGETCQETYNGSALRTHTLMHTRYLVVDVVTATLCKYVFKPHGRSWKLNIVHLYVTNRLARWTRWVCTATGCSRTLTFSRRTTPLPQGTSLLFLL